MKYVKNFENFNYDTTNENWLFGEGNIWSKMGNWIRNWKDRKLAEGARLAIEWAKNNPEKIEELKSEVKPMVDKISEEDKKKVLDTLQNFQGTLPAEVLNENRGWDFIGKVCKNLCRFMGWTLLLVPFLSVVVGFIMSGLGITTGILVVIGGAIMLLPSLIVGATILGETGDMDIDSGGGGSFRSGFTG
jgi:hypothetical protein